MIDLALKIILISFLFLVIIKDVRSYTISLYHLIGISFCTLYLSPFSLLGGLLGGVILLSIFFVIYISQRKISETIGSGDILLLSVLFFVTPLSHISTLLLLSGILSLLFFYLFKRDYVPLGAGIAFAYGIIIFLL